MSESDQPVYIIIGRVWVDKDLPEIPVHILLRASDDDSAIREALNALAEDDYAEAEFDQIGTLTDAPFEEPHASAYQGAMEGEISIVTFDAEGLVPAEAPGSTHLEDDEDYNPFDTLKDWKPEQ